MVDLSIIIPCYNEVNNIAKIAYQIDKIKKKTLIWYSVSLLLIMDQQIIQNLN